MLSTEQLEILREGATEPPFSSELLHNKESGNYSCAYCGQVLFKSDNKFDSGSGWPSFYDIAKQGAVKLVEDKSLGMERTEVRCASCDSHLGHLFDDAYNQPTGMRYCINGLALKFSKV